MTSEERLARIEGLLFEIALKLGAGTDERTTDAQQGYPIYPHRSFSDEAADNLKRNLKRFRDSDMNLSSNGIEIES